MFCAKCGAEIKDDVKFCTACGEAVVPAVAAAEEEVAPVYKAVEPEVVRVEASHTVAVEAEPEGKKASMILGIISTALGGVSICSSFFGIAFGIAGLICGNIGKNKCYDPHVLTTVGFWVSFGGLIWSIIWTLIMIAMW